MGNKDVAFNLLEDNLPEGWSIRKLSEVAEINTTSLKKTDKVDKIQYVDISSVSERRILQKVEYSFENAPSRARRKVEDGDTIISTVRPNLKAYAYIKNPPKNLVVSTGFAVVRPKKEDYKKYYHYYLTSDQYINYLVLNTRGSAYPAVDVKTIEESNVIVPTSLEAKKIGEILSAFDDKIELNNEMNKTLEEIAQAIFKHWFIDFEFPNENGEPYKSSGGEFVDSELGPIPKGWEVKKLDEVVRIKYGKILPIKKLKNNGYPVYGGNGIIGYYDEYLYEQPQVIIACRGAASGKVLTTYPKSFITNNSLVLELPNENRVFYFYLKYYCLNYPFYKYATGSAQPQITIENIKFTEILVPEISIIEKYNDIIKNIEEIVYNREIQNQTLSQLRDTLLPKLISGEIRVM